MEAGDLVVDALAQLGIEARPPTGGPDARSDLVIDPQGVATTVEVTRRSLVTDDVARHLLDEAAPDAVLLIGGDRVTESARRLRPAGVRR